MALESLPKQGGTALDSFSNYVLHAKKPNRTPRSRMSIVVRSSTICSRLHCLKCNSIGHTIISRLYALWAVISQNCPSAKLGRISSVGAAGTKVTPHNCLRRKMIEQQRASALHNVMDFISYQVKVNVFECYYLSNLSFYV